MNDTQLPQGRDVSVPLQQIILQATGLSLLMLIVPILPFGVLWGWGTLFADWDGFTFVLLLVLFTAVHEGFHAVGWKYWGGLNWRDLESGIKWEALAPYVHAKKPMRADAYRLGALLPLIMTGFFPYGIAMLVGSGLMTIVSATMISGAVGDVYVLWIMRGVNPSAMVVDHPDNAGCIVVDEGGSS